MKEDMKETMRDPYGIKAKQQRNDAEHKRFEKALEEYNSFHGRAATNAERREAQKCWDKLDSQTKATYIQTAATFIPKTVGTGTFGRTLPADTHIGRIVAYAMKMAYMAENSHDSAVAHY